jgi:hypothetical protein
MKLMPEAQEQMLEEADELIGDVPLLDSQRLLTLLETLQDHTEEEVHRKINQIFEPSVKFPAQPSMGTESPEQQPLSRCPTDGLMGIPEIRQLGQPKEGIKRDRSFNLRNS